MGKLRPLVIVSDTHFQQYEIYGVSRTLRNSRLMDKLQSFSVVVQYAIKVKAPWIVHLGDLFHQPNPGDDVREAVAKVLSLYIRRGGRILLVKGNHDGAGTMSPWHSEAHFTNSVVVVDQPCFMELNDWGPIVCLPQCAASNDPAARKALFSAVIMRPLAVFGHGIIKGATAGLVTFDSGISAGELELFGAPVAVFGDIHKRQVRKSGKFTCGYIGALNHQDFGERKYRTGFGVLRGSRLFYVPVRDREFVQLELHEGREFPPLPIRHSKRKPVVKMIFSGSAAWFHTAKVRSYVQQVEKRALKILDDYRIKREVVKELVIDSDFSIQAVFRKYTKSNRVSPALVKVGKSLLAQANEMD